MYHVGYGMIPAAWTAQWPSSFSTAATASAARRTLGQRRLPRPNPRRDHARKTSKRKVPLWTEPPAGLAKQIRIPTNPWDRDSSGPYSQWAKFELAQFPPQWGPGAGRMDPPKSQEYYAQFRYAGEWGAIHHGSGVNQCRRRTTDLRRAYPDRRHIPRPPDAPRPTAPSGPPERLPRLPRMVRRDGYISRGRLERPAKRGPG